MEETITNYRTITIFLTQQTYVALALHIEDVSYPTKTPTYHRYMWFHLITFIFLNYYCLHVSIKILKLANYHAFRIFVKQQTYISPTLHIEGVHCLTQKPT